MLSQLPVSSRHDEHRNRVLSLADRAKCFTSLRNVLQNVLHKFYMQSKGMASHKSLDLVSQVDSNPVRNTVNTSSARGCAAAGLALFLFFFSVCFSEFYNGVQGGVEMFYIKKHATSIEDC